MEISRSAELKILKLPSSTSPAPSKRTGLSGSTSVGSASKSMCLTSSARRSVNSWRPTMSEVALRPELELQRRRAARDARQEAVLGEPDHLGTDPVEEDLARRLRRQVLPAGDDRGLRWASDLLAPASRSPIQARAAVRAPPDVPLSPTILNRSWTPRAEEGLQRAGDEGALTAASLTGDGDAFCWPRVSSVSRRTARFLVGSPPALSTRAGDIAPKDDVSGGCPTGRWAGPTPLFGGQLIHGSQEFQAMNGGVR